MSKMIVVTGDVVSGLKFTGPFSNQAELLLYMNTLSDYEAERVVVADLTEFPLPEPVVEAPHQFLIVQTFKYDSGEHNNYTGAFDTPDDAVDWINHTGMCGFITIARVET